MSTQDFYIRAVNLLSQHIASLKPYGVFLSELACMNKEEREIIGYIKGYTVLYPEDKDFNKFLERVIVLLKYIGLSKWGRTELTDLGLMIGEKLSSSIELDEKEIRDWLGKYERK